MTKPIRVYADTSVYGGLFDEGFEEPPRTFFENVRAGKFTLVLSDVVEREIRGAPESVRSLFREMALIAEVVEALADAVSLQQAYLRHGIVGPAAMSDALHVAAATVSNCPILLSWNLKHSVHFQKIPLYNGVNRSECYQEISIYTPLEVMEGEDENL